MSNNNPFGKRGWALDRIPDVTGKVYVITGGNSGIGFEAAQVLAGKGAKVIILCRNEKKALKAVNAIKSKTGSQSDISYRLIELASLENVRKAANNLKEELPEIHGLICNAGLMMLPKRELTVDGFEMQIGVNHLGHFLFSSILFENVERAQGRFVSVSSGAYLWGLRRIKFEDINFDKEYTPPRSYGQSKLANMLYVHELQRRLRANGKTIDAYVCHPGYAATNLQTTGPGMLSGLVMTVTNALLAHSALHGAKSILLTATDPEAKPATFYGPTRYGNMKGPIGENILNKCGTDMEAAHRLWELSEKLTGANWPV